MMDLRGTIQSGAGQGAYFTGLDWVKKQFQEAMGFEPHPGTVNVRIADEDLPRLDDFFATKDFEIVPPDSRFCAGSFKRVRLNGLPGAAVFPSDEVRIHGRDIVEIICGCRVKDTLHLKDGDPVLITPLDGE
jgi:riboflavin kinase, archaea type